MNSPLVSVCIPCHNAAAYVGDAIQSILDQTWQSIEVIVVDDGSTDGSREVLQCYASDKVKIIRQDNQGQCAAANRAFAEAQGRLIKFFDADDILSIETIEHQVRRLAERTDAIASAPWGRFYNNDISTFQLNHQSVWRDLPTLSWLVEAWNDAHPMMQCGLWLIPREILDTSGGWDESLSLINDFEFFTRVLCHANHVLFVPEATLYYRSGLSSSLSGQKSRAAWESAFNSLMRGTSYLLERQNDFQALRSCANILQNYVYSVYPDCPDLRFQATKRISELGGSDLAMPAGPRLRAVQRLLGWKAAKRLQLLTGRG